MDDQNNIKVPDGDGNPRSMGIRDLSGKNHVDVIIDKNRSCAQYGVAEIRLGGKSAYLDRDVLMTALS